MTQRRRSAKNFRGLSPLIVAACALTFYIVLLPRELRLPAKHPQIGRGLDQSASTNGLGEDSDSSVLLDSIVSLVQNYYVDSARVSGEKLIIGTMRSLAYAIPELRFDEGLETYSLSKNSETLSFNKETEMGYDEVLGRLKSVVGFCDRIKVSELLGSGDNVMLGADRDSPAIVLNALLSSLDAHSSLLSADSYQELRQGTEGSFGGLGVLVGVRDHVLTVLKPLPKSPAMRVGVKQNDRIVAIDGFSTFGVSLDRLVTHMRGAPGTTAELVTLRPGEWAPQKIKLEREIIAVDSVEASEYHQNNSHILRLAVENFASRTTKEIREHIRSFRQRYKMTGLVLDLRGNPGGLLDQAVHVSDLFLDSGVVVTTRGRREEIERANHGLSDETDYPMIVLMNEDSASASEIVAGALQDNGRAIVVGQPSFGKGSVQTVFELPEQRALKLTIARYFTPGNKSIQNVGIMPDVWIQPIIKNAENANLFGSYRYRNEQFLPNHLVAAPQVASGSFVASSKGYFLVSDANAEGGPKAIDPSMDVAMAVFGKLLSTYGSQLPEGARRSSHWLALTRSSVQEILNPLSRKALAWLHAAHSVQWQVESPRLLSTPSVELKILAPSEGLAASAGGFLEVPWQIKNNGAASVDNLSVYTQSPVSGFETKEFLVGHIDSGEVRQGVLKIQVPAAVTAGKRYVNVGVAIDAQALPKTQDEFLVNILEQHPELVSVDAGFVDGAASRMQNVLEANERGSISVLVSNKGKTEIRNVKVSVNSLAGRQVNLLLPESQIPTLAAGEERRLLIPIEARAKLEPGSVVFGVAVKYSSNSDPIFATADVNIHSNLGPRKVSTLSH